MKKTKYQIEVTENYEKTERIDELEDGSQTSSTILQNKDYIILQMNKNHHRS